MPFVDEVVSSLHTDRPCRKYLECLNVVSGLRAIGRDENTSFRRRAMYCSVMICVLYASRVEVRFPFDLPCVARRPTSLFLSPTGALPFVFFHFWLSLSVFPSTRTTLPRERRERRPARSTSYQCRVSYRYIVPPKQELERDVISGEFMRLSFGHVRKWWRRIRASWAGTRSKLSQNKSRAERLLTKGTSNLCFLLEQRAK